MAYNRGYNPDALPAHAEPEQAAAMLSGGSTPSPHPTNMSRPPRTSSATPSYNKPQPPPPGPGRSPVHPHQGIGSPPPPQGYGQGPPPQGYHGRPPVNRPPPTPAPGAGGDRDSYWPLFRAVDRDGTGALSERELRAALINGDMTSFDPHTVRMMIRMFDTDRSGTIDFNEFCGLWGFLAAWRNLFDRFDADRSGNISYSEFADALVAFGYRLSPQFVSLLFRTYDRRGENAISFDLFVQACISLKRMTDVFKKYDEDRDGYITLSFEEFLTEIIRQR